MTNSRLSVVHDVNFGVYVWITDDNRVVQDQDGNYMNISARLGDQLAISQLASAARHYGIVGGRAHFVAGARPVSDEEYQEQLGRMLEGEIPDPNDPGILKDELRNARK